MLYFVVFALLSVVSSKSIFDESLAYVDLSDDLIQGEAKVAAEEANTKGKKPTDFHASSTNRLEVVICVGILIGFLMVLCFDICVSFIRIYISKHGLAAKPPPYISKSFVKGLLHLFNLLICGGTTTNSGPAAGPPAAGPPAADPPAHSTPYTTIDSEQGLLEESAI